MSRLTDRQRRAHEALDFKVALTADQLADILGTSHSGAVRTASSLVDRGDAVRTRHNGRVAYLRGRGSAS